MSTISRPLLAFTALLAAGIGSVQADAAVRLKDIVNFEGSRDNLLVGYGLVVGLHGTGDDVTKSIFTRESVIGMLDRLGVNARDAQLTVRTKNVAAVMVTATLPSSARQGGRIDVAVSAMGDAQDLQGGTLVGVPMLGADGEVYAVAQGQVSVGGFSAKGAAASISQGVPTAGKVPDGAIVEREIAFDLSKMQTMNIALRNPDFTTAERIATAINTYMHGSLAHATDSGTVQLAIPAAMRSDVVGLVTRLEQLRIEPDQVAKVIIDDANGVIVMGENVKISTVAVAQGNLTVKITETPQVSQPGPLSNGTTQVVPRTDIQVDTGKDRRLAVVPQGITIQELVNSLNALGIGPRDMISILQAIKAAGAMQADLEGALMDVPSAMLPQSPVPTPSLGTYGRTGALAGSGGKLSDAQMAAIDKTAKDYEAGFVSAMLESMFAGVKTNKMFGGGSAEGMYRSLLNQEYGKAIAAHGTLGIADAIKREMLHLQEAH